MRLLRFIALFLASVSFTVLAEEAPANVANRFLAVYLKPNPTHLPLSEVLKNQVSEALLFQLKALEAAENIAGECDPGPPIYEGDLFTSYAEPAERFRLLSCQANNGTARCSVALEAGSAKNLLRWRDTLVLVMEKGHWKVTDIDRSDGPGPKLASTKISALICGVAATCPDAKWPNSAMHRTCPKIRASP